jgi:glycosyltransferase 2 family protein
MNWKLWLGIVVSLALLWFAFRGVDLGEVARTLATVRPGWVALVVLSLPVRFWLTAVRWQVLLRPVKRIGVHRLFGITLIGFMANNILPARIGEFVRAYAVGHSEAIPAPLAFATVVIERIFDGFTLLLFLVGGLFFLSLPGWLLWLSAASFCLYLAVLGGLLSLRWSRSRRVITGLLVWLPARLRAPAAHVLDSFCLGLDTLGDGQSLLAIGGLSLVIWIVNALGLQATFQAFALDLPLHAGFFALAILAGVLVLPSAPGYVGTFQFATKVALALFGVPEATALSLSILYHAVNYVPITLAGLVYLGAFNLTLGELKSAGEKPRE